LQQCNSNLMEPIGNVIPGHNHLQITLIYYEKYET
jgi:hypothetical protein